LGENQYFLIVLPPPAIACFSAIGEVHELHNFQIGFSYILLGLLLHVYLNIYQRAIHQLLLDCYPSEYISANMQCSVTFRPLEDEKCSVW
jgi:hypothetical protein